MKAIIWTRFGPPDVLVLKEVEKPVPKNNEVLIKIYATTVTSGDCEMRENKQRIWYRIPIRIFVGLTRPKRINILGMELAGIIEGVGKDVKSFKPGDRVFAATGFESMGTCAEYICIPEEPVGGAIALKPDTITYEEATAVPVGGLEAINYLKQGKIQAGQKILINGAGGTIGPYAVQLAKHIGAEVTGVDSTDKLGLLLSLGADRVIDYPQDNFTKSTEKYDIIIDLVGKHSFSSIIKVLRADGFCILGNPRLTSIIQGFWVSRTSSKKVLTGVTSEKSEDLNLLKDLIEAGVLKAVTDRYYPLEEVAEAHIYVEKGQKKGNVVIKVAQNE